MFPLWKYFRSSNRCSRQILKTNFLFICLTVKLVVNKPRDLNIFTRIRKLGKIKVNWKISRKHEQITRKAPRKRKINNFSSKQTICSLLFSAFAPFKAWHSMRNSFQFYFNSFLACAWSGNRWKLWKHSKIYRDVKKWLPGRFHE